LSHFRAALVHRNSPPCFPSPNKTRRGGSGSLGEISSLSHCRRGGFRDRPLDLLQLGRELAAQRETSGAATSFSLVASFDLLLEFARFAAAGEHIERLALGSLAFPATFCEVQRSCNFAWRHRPDLDARVVRGDQGVDGFGESYPAPSRKERRPMALSFSTKGPRPPGNVSRTMAARRSAWALIARLPATASAF